jgi:RNA polymerase sigma-70 factor, ECF subfamily
MILTSISVISPVVVAMSDAQLIGAMCDGRPEALEALFSRYVRLVYRVAADILKDQAEAEDSTQEVFLEIYRKAHLYDPSRGSVRGWLLQYAYRRTLRRKTVLGRRAAYRGEPIEAADQVRQPQPRLTREECGWVLRSALAHLPERQRTTLELTCFEDLTLRDVAERLGVSVGCTRHYYYRGLARLQKWARVTDGHLPTGCRDASGAGTTDGATVRARQPFDRA